MLDAASAQLSNAPGLVSGVAASMADAKAIDAQHGVEKGVAAGLRGHLVYESSGMTASLLGISFEAFVLDDEMHSAIYRALRSVEVSDETLGLGAIREAALGEGHFLGSAHTHAAMERDHFYPSQADREAPVAWAQKGSRDARSRARERARAILGRHRPDHLDDRRDAAIRAAFPIRWPSRTASAPES